MNAVKIIENAKYSLEHNTITSGEYDKIVKPLEDVEHIRHGHWVKIDGRHAGCSVCKSLFEMPDVITLCDLPMYETRYKQFKVENPYCRKCGTKMDEVTEDEK